ncbi:MAG: hypothetical protein ABUL47_07385, partial [Leifsonia sp.]
MGSGGLLGGGIVIVLAAVLWLIYLIPTWLHRREYMATERNAVKLQQTLRILAESSEVPDAVRVDANARSLAQHQRMLRRAKRQEAHALKVREKERAREEAQAKEVARVRKEALKRAEAQADAE